MLICHSENSPIASVPISTTANAAYSVVRTDHARAGSPPARRDARFPWVRAADAAAPAVSRSVPGRARSEIPIIDSPVLFLPPDRSAPASPFGRPPRIRGTAHFVRVVTNDGLSARTIFFLSPGHHRLSEIQ
ncbi:hypothetical protein Bpla01_19670 [Burkholderia plantarii]|nr:hypothetical protein Bpla01_19670 [Burkholderia plantarii]